MFKANKEAAWVFKVVAAVVADSVADAHAKCLKRHAQVVRRNAKFLLNHPEIVLFIAKIAFRSARTADGNRFLL